MRSLSLTFAFILLVCAAQELASAAPQDSSDFKPLFNGKDLSGWDGDSRMWSVKDGVIHGETTSEIRANRNTFLIWEGLLEDFELKLSFRCNAVNNSGIQYRSTRIAPAGQNKWRVKGYQHEVRNENEVPNVPGFIYDEGGKRGRICLAGEKAEWNEDGKKSIETFLTPEQIKNLIKVDEWNDVRIVAKGNHIQHYLNGELFLDFTDNHPKLALSKGVLALQLHAGKPMWAEFKDIMLREIKSDDASSSAVAQEKEKTVQIQYLEIVTPDVEALCKQYSENHGVTFSEPVAEFGNARTATLSGGGKIGIRGPLRDNEAPIVRPYMLVEDIDKAVKAAAEAGAEVAMPPMTIPGQGKFAIVIQGGIQRGLWQN